MMVRMIYNRPMAFPSLHSHLVLALRAALCCAVLALLAACGGGKDDEETAVQPPPAPVNPVGRGSFKASAPLGTVAADEIAATLRSGFLAPRIHDH